MAFIPSYQNMMDTLLKTGMLPIDISHLEEYTNAKNFPITHTMSATPVPALPPIFLKSRFENLTLMMSPVPNQEALAGKFVENEFSKIAGALTTVQNYTVGSTFVATDYEITDQSTIFIKAIKPFFFQKSVFKGTVPPELEMTQAEYEAWIEYLLTVEPQNEQDPEIVAQEFVNFLDIYQIKIDLEAVKKKVQGSSGASTGPAILKTIQKSYPVPKLENTGFSIKKTDWQLYVRNVLKTKNTLLAGPTGSGKTETLRIVCQELGIPLHIVDMGTMQDAQAGLCGTHRLDSTGKSVFDPAPLVGYIQEKCVVLLDELNRSPLAANNILFSLLDARRYLALDIATEGEARKIPVHEECVFFATANIGMEYSGTQAIDRALMDRFMIIHTEYPTESIEADILIKRTGVNKKIAGTIAKVASSIRGLALKDELSNAVSVRHTIEAAEMVVDGFTPIEALQCVFLPLYNNDFGGGERNTVNSLISAH